MGDHPQPGQAFMSALVTEHFVLQTARSTTVTEAVGRSGVYLTCVSSALVAFGFFAAATHRLAPVVATVLPALIILGSSPGALASTGMHASPAEMFFTSAQHDRRSHQHPRRRRCCAAAGYRRHPCARGRPGWRGRDDRDVRLHLLWMYRRGQPAMA
jgi:hypothetical protein